VLLCKPLDFAGHNIHLQVSLEVIISNVPGCIDHVPEYFVLKSLSDCNKIRFFLSRDFRKIIKYKFLLKSLPLALDLFDTGRQTDRHEEVNSRFSQILRKHLKILQVLGDQLFDQKIDHHLLSKNCIVNNFNFLTV